TADPDQGARRHRGTDMSDLHTRITAAIDQAEERASTATRGPWARDTTGDVYAIRRHPITAHVAEVDSTADAEYIAANDPASRLRGLAEDRDILRRHVRENHKNGRYCAWCVLKPYPCAEV